MVIGASAEEPVIFALAIFDRQVVDAGDPPSHQALFVELPILVAITTKPVARIVMPFICKAHGYPVVAKRPYLLDQPILQLANPLACEECLDRLAATNELGAVAPDAIHQAARALVFSEDISQQLGSGVSYYWLIADISGRSHRHAEPDKSCYLVERSQMLLRNSESIERREVSRFAPRFHIELRADPP